MARNLTSIPDIDPASSDYPVGRIRNEDPPTTGTPIIEELYGDIVQFFHKLMRIAGITHNGLAENESTGFQFIAALAYYIRSLGGSTSQKGTWQAATNAETQGGVVSTKVVTPASLESKTASQTRAGIAPIATNIAIDSSTNDTMIITPRGLARRETSFKSTVLANLQTKILEIGDWNMDSTNTVTIAHGVTGTKIREVHAEIRNDDDSVGTSLLCQAVNTNAILRGDTNIVLTRTAGDIFDNTGYNSTSYNRGWITIKYLP